ncbi:MAG: hypothetical protein GTO53_05170 [Planctomycetales bacterium]|nr:hypothetical protein [Planctomycetales bacterium]NIM08544.1 hypothetical protein [Planctomycetales bacterium]NIN08015.1 hypothetical protein [Planctomycetales bacterium]NIN77144.1 hypothetical protein [Planctomycetales bacterium]NIO34328.1 hypothetical protein [Planctomycetales bacterium]
MPDPREHAENRNLIETVLRHIPGFRGYLEKEYRRESDSLQRQWLADRLDRSKRGLDDFSRALVDAGQIDDLPQCDRLRGRIDKLSSRIRSAMDGYSGFFDLVRIDESVLDRVYRFDGELIDRVDDFATRVEGLPAEPASGGVAVAHLLNETEALEKVWDERDDILKGLD